MVQQIAIAYFALCLGASIVLGEKDAFYAAAIALLGSLATAIAPSSRWHDFEPWIFLIDFGVMIGFWWIAMRSIRFWPYWITGWQLVTVMIHLQRAASVDIFAKAYGYSSIYSSVPIVTLILVAAISSIRNSYVASLLKRRRGGKHDG